MNERIRKIALASLFITLSVILTRFFSGNPVVISGFTILRISFGQVPIMLSGLVLGPVFGAATGAIADLIGYPLNPMGSYFPGFTLSAALTGLIPGLFYHRNQREWTWFSLFAVIALTEFITSICLNTLWVNIMTGKAFLALLPVRLTSTVILIPIHTSMVKLLLKYCRMAVPSSG